MFIGIYASEKLTQKLDIAAKVAFEQKISGQM